MSTSLQRSEQVVSHHAPKRARFISTKEAAQLFSYSADYVSRLAREGKVLAEQRNRQWFVSTDSLKMFALQQADEQRARQRELREQRLREYAQTQRVASTVAVNALPKTQALSAALAAGVVATCLLLLGALSWTVIEEDLQVAQLSTGAQTVLAELRDVFPFGTTEPLPAAPVVAAHQVQIVDGALVVQNGTALEAAFSDPVAVHNVSTSSALITPVFGTDAGTVYQLEVTAVSNNSTI